MSVYHRIPTVSFNKWILLEWENRRILLFSLVIIVVMFGLFKLLYPYPNFMPPDSQSYIEAAYNNDLINIWAIGYSKFLRLFSCLTKSDFILVLFQYLLLQSSVLYFLFSLAYLISISRRMFSMLVGFNILNPLLLHISNFISSDSLFTALSLLWFTQLIWILCKPSRRIILLHAFLLLLVFIMRYSALYYPFISLMIIVIAKVSANLKWAGIGCILFLLGGFVVLTQYQYYKQTATWQYSAFGGWQLAANALYGYAHVKTDAVEIVPARFRPLHVVVNRHMDSIQHLSHRPDDDNTVYYLWDEKAPLKVFANSKKWEGDSGSIGGFNHWAAMGPLYRDYGRYLILQHPKAFVKYFIWPNLVSYYAPPVGFMGEYNLGSRSVAPIVAVWFGWRSNKVRTCFKDSDIIVVRYFSVIWGVSNLVFLMGFVSFGFKDHRSSTLNGDKVLWLTRLLWCVNMTFSVLAAPVELRYQLFSMIIMFTISILVITLIFQGKRIQPL